MSGTEFRQLLHNAEATTAQESWTTAAVLWRQVTNANPVHGNHWARLGQASDMAGDLPAAIAAYERADELGIRIDIVQPGYFRFQIARCYARLGELDHAKTHLRRAFDAGYRDVHTISEELAPLRDELLNNDATGWDADLNMLTREVHRKAPHIPADFDTDVAKVRRSIPHLTDTQVVVELTRLVASLGDGHAFLDVPAESAQLPLEFYLFEEGLYVVATDPTHRHLLGTRVDTFDGHPVNEAIAAVTPLISRVNDHRIKDKAPELLRLVPYLHALGVATEPDRVALNDVVVAAQTGDPDQWIQLPDTIDTPLPLYLRDRKAPYWYEPLPGETYYFQWNSVRDDSFGAFLDRLFGNDMSRLIIDLRWNDGGSVALVKPLLHSLIRAPEVGLFVIIGRRTFSAAQQAATLLEAHTDATFVGEPTGSRPNFVGETIPFPLPYSRLNANVSDMYWQASWPLDDRTWIAPDLFVPPTFAAFAANRDPALEAILAMELS